VGQAGYTYKWTVPIRTSTADTGKFVIQTQGYGPAAVVFKPCPHCGGGPDGVGSGQYLRLIIVWVTSSGECVIEKQSLY
jgi:hypothetical protein